MLWNANATDTNNLLCWHIAEIWLYGNILTTFILFISYQHCSPLFTLFLFIRFNWRADENQHCLNQLPIHSEVMFNVHMMEDTK